MAASVIVNPSDGFSRPHRPHRNRWVWWLAGFFMAAALLWLWKRTDFQTQKGWQAFLPSNTHVVLESPTDSLSNWLNQLPLLGNHQPALKQTDSLTNAALAGYPLKNTKRYYALKSTNAGHITGWKKTPPDFEVAKLNNNKLTFEQKNEWLLYSVDSSLSNTAFDDDRALPSFVTQLLEQFRVLKLQSNDPRLYIRQLAADSMAPAFELPRQAAYLEASKTKQGWVLNGQVMPALSDKKPKTPPLSVDKLSRWLPQQAVWAVQGSSPTAKEIILWQSLSGSRNTLSTTMIVFEANHDSLQKQLASDQKKSPVIIKYKDYDLRQTDLPLTEKYLPHTTLWFETLWYVTIDNHLALSNSRSGLIQLINTQLEQNDWKHSVVYQTFLEQLLAQADFTFWCLPEALEKPYKLPPFLKAWLPYDFKDKMVCLQWQRAGSLNWLAYRLQKRVNRQPAQSDQGKVLAQTFFQHPLEPVLSIVKSHTSGHHEMLCQDSEHLIYLINNRGRHAMTYLARSAVKQPGFVDLDFYRNGKTQYFFATAEALHVIDRTGNDVKPFPISLSDNKPLAFGNVIDYDGKYPLRFVAADTAGNLWLFDGKGKALEGWNGRINAGGSLAVSPFHVRISGKDAIVTISQNGTVSLYNRRGEPYIGFPVRLESKISLNTDYIINRQRQFGNSWLVVQATNGQVFKIYLDGQVKKAKTPELKKNQKLLVISNKARNEGILLLYDQKQASVLSIETNQVKHRFEGNFDDFQYLTSDETTYLLAKNSQTNTCAFFNLNSGKAVLQDISCSGPSLVVSDKNQDKIYLLEDRMALQMALP